MTIAVSRSSLAGTASVFQHSGTAMMRTIVVIIPTKTCVVREFFSYTAVLLRTN